MILSKTSQNQILMLFCVQLAAQSIKKIRNQDFEKKFKQIRKLKQKSLQSFFAAN